MNFTCNTHFSIGRTKHYENKHKKFLWIRRNFYPPSINIPCYENAAEMCVMPTNLSLKYVKVHANCFIDAETVRKCTHYECQLEYELVISLKHRNTCVCKFDTTFFSKNRYCSIVGWLFGFSLTHLLPYDAVIRQL